MQCLMFYTNSIVYQCLLWISVSIFFMLFICYTCLLFRPIYATHKHLIYLMFFTATIVTLGTFHLDRIVSLIIIPYISYKICNILSIIHDLGMFSISWCLLYIYLHLNVIFSLNLNHLRKKSIIFCIRCFFLGSIISYASTLITIAAIGNQEWMIKGDSKVTVIIIDILFWLIFIAIFIISAWYLYFRVRPVYIYGFGNNVLKVIRFMTFTVAICVVFWSIFSILFQILMMNTYEGTNMYAVFRTILFFVQITVDDFFPMTSFFIMHIKIKETESYSFLDISKDQNLNEIESNK